MCKQLTCRIQSLVAEYGVGAVLAEVNKYSREMPRIFERKEYEVFRCNQGDLQFTVTRRKEDDKILINVTNSDNSVFINYSNCVPDYFSED